MTSESDQSPRRARPSREQPNPRLLGHALKGALARIWLATSNLSRQVTEHPSRDREAGELRRGLAEADEVAEALLGPMTAPLDEPPPLDVNALLLRMEPSLQLTVGSSIRLHVRTMTCSTAVLAESAALEAVIRTLVARAARAMPEGGELMMSTGWVDCFSGSWPYDRFPPRRYIRLTMADTALTNAAEGWRRVLEPPGTPAITGPSLAATVGQLRGYVVVEGAEGEPSRIHMCLPAAAVDSTVM